MNEISILICTINSDPVFRMTKFLSKLFPKAKYHVVTVIRPIKHRAVLTRLYRKYAEDLVKETQERVTTILLKHGIKNIENHILHGKPAHMIIEYAKKNNIDLIAITPRARMSKEHEIGSTAERVLVNANVPVLLYTVHSDPIITKTVKIGVIDGKESLENIRKIIEALKQSHEIEVNKIEKELLNKTIEIKERITHYDLIVSDKDAYISYSLHKYVWAPTLLF